MCLNLFLMIGLANFFMHIEAARFEDLDFYYTHCSFTSKNSFERNRTMELRCCSETAEFYWWRKSPYLSTFLQTLKTWDCPEFEQECAKKTFAFTEFNRLLYSTFCNQSEVEAQCYDDVLNVINKQNPAGGLTAFRSWINLTQYLNLIHIEDDDLSNPCIQAAMLNADLNGLGRFHEIISIFTPIFGITWCGFDEKIFTTRHVSIWTCISLRHGAGIILIAVICSLFAVAISICNVIALIVFCANKNQMNASTVYKISIAFSDFLVGLIVFPTFISTMLTRLVRRQTLGDVGNATIFLPANNSDGFNDVALGEIHEPHTRDALLSQSYLDFVGFFTVLPVGVSLYSLLAIAVDRFIALYRPIKYQIHSSVSIARKVVLCIWVLFILLASLPFYVASLRYSINSPMLVYLKGTIGLYIGLMLTFVLPLLVLWTFSLAAYYVIKTHNRKSTVVKSIRKAAVATEIKVARTLGMMVAVFTFCKLSFIALYFIFVGLIATDPEHFLYQSTFSAYTISYDVIIIISTSNSLWNFFIYNARDKRFRKATKKLFTDFGSYFTVKRS